jgi:molecular chaperone Hsp33
LNLPSEIDTRPDDLIQPFRIDPFALRGRLVRLGPTVDRILSQHDYPEPVAAVLGEAITLAVMLSGMLKYDGVFTLQTKSDGPVKLIVADVSTEGAVRGYAQYDRDRLGSVPAPGFPKAGGSPSVPALIGSGYIAFTVDQGEHTERYQGIVELVGGTLAECVHHYFRQSEQVEAALKVAVAQLPDAGGARQWRAGALMIQRLPRESFTLERETEDDAWRRAAIFMSSSTSAELVDPALAPERLLFRLFHEDGVRAHTPHPLAAQCRCSQRRVETVLRALTPDEILDMKVDGKITVTCEFCSAVYDFDDAALEALVPG